MFSFLQSIQNSQKRKEAKPIPWESPKTDVTKLLEEKEGFVDCRSDVLNKSGPIATCRYICIMLHLSSRIT